MYLYITVSNVYVCLEVVLYLNVSTFQPFPLMWYKQCNKNLKSLCSFDERYSILPFWENHTEETGAIGYVQCTYTGSL